MASNEKNKMLYYGMFQMTCFFFNVDVIQRLSIFIFWLSYYNL